MKILISLFLTLLFSFFAFSQTTKEMTVEEKYLVTRLQSIEDQLFQCYEEYFNNSAANKQDALSKCREKGIAEIATVYGELSKNISAVKWMLGNELNDKVFRNRMGIYSKSEIELKSQVQLQRILVIQNQRIIELLEQLVKKK